MISASPLTRLTDTETLEDGIAESLKLDGSETISLPAVDGLQTKQVLTLTLTRSDGGTEELEVLCRLDTDQEVIFFQSGGILNHVLLQLMQ